MEVWRYLVSPGPGSLREVEALSLKQTYSNEKQENENDATLERHLSYQPPFAVSFSTAKISP